MNRVASLAILLLCTGCAEGKGIGTLGAIIIFALMLALLGKS